MGAVKRVHGVAEGGESAADLAVAAFGHGDLVDVGVRPAFILEEGLAPPLGAVIATLAGSPLLPRSLFARAGAVRRFDSRDRESTDAVVESDTVVTYHLLMDGCEGFVEGDFVDFSFGIARMGELFGEGAVIG